MLITGDHGPCAASLPNPIGSALRDDDLVGLAWLDLSSGQFSVTELDGTQTLRGS